MDPITTLLVFPVAAGVLATARPQFERYLENFQRSQVTYKVDTEHAVVVRIPTATEMVLTTSPVVQDKRAALQKAIARFAALPDGWDGEGSTRPSSFAVDAAKEFLASLPSGISLPTPMVTAEGEMEFYWKLRIGYADVSFDADGVGSFFARDEVGGEIFVDGLGTDFRKYPDQKKILSILAPHLLVAAA